jgi:hypothetical protein
MRRRPVVLRILILLCALVGARPALAAPIVFASALDDGTNSGVAAVIEGAGATPLSLWLDPDGTEFYEYLVSFSADPGLVLLSFEASPIDGVPPTDVVFAPGDAGILALISGSAFDPQAGPVRIGTLVVSGVSVGAELRLTTLPGVAPPALVDGSFGLVPIEAPRRIAQVAPIPEPRSIALFLAGGIVVACAVARSARV